ncbi:MAG: hypothetical protein OXB94_10365 [Nitrospira sp.]|nr:hypothetical protein [Nitrospira sp.]
MNGVLTPVKPGIIFALFFFCMAWTGTQGVHAALLDGLLDDVEESLAEGLTQKGEKLTTGNFYTDDKPNSHAPIGMMGDHTHEAGEVMFSYRLMHMFMKGNRYGTDRLTTADVTRPGQPVPSGYLIAPESMRMRMHMFGFMYGLNDTVTLTLMVPYLSNSMDHVTRMGGKFTTRSEGFGDIRFGSLWRLWAVEAPSIGAHRFHFNLSLSVPTGSIEPTDRTPLGPNSRLPYPMHLGSGTFDFYPGITYGGEMGHASWGIQAIGTLRAGTNSNDFSKGDAYTINAFGAYEVIENTLSSSIRLSWNHWEAYDGMDPAIRTNHPMNGMRIVQTAFPDLLGGQRLDILFGVNVLFPDFMGLENRLAMEGGFPVYQYLDGQLETDSVVTFGWQAVY